MEGKHKVEMWVWACVTIMIVCLISSITYYNIITPSVEDRAHEYKKQVIEYKENMIKIYGISPAVLECIDRNWSDLSVYQICKEVLANHNMTKQQAEKLAEKLRELDK